MSERVCVSESGAASLSHALVPSGNKMWQQLMLQFNMWVNLNTDLQHHQENIIRVTQVFFLLLFFLLGYWSLYHKVIYCKMFFLSNIKLQLKFLSLILFEEHTNQGKQKWKKNITPKTLSDGVFDVSDCRQGNNYSINYVSAHVTEQASALFAWPLPFFRHRCVINKPRCACVPDLKWVLPARNLQWMARWPLRLIGSCSALL